MTKQEFMKSKPFELKAYGKAHEMKVKSKDEELWLQGWYNLEAFQVVFSHFSAGMAKKKCNAEYPKEPISFAKKSNELTEEEIIEQRKAFVAMLQAQKANFEINHTNSSE